jgi:hypothetical protein
MVTYLINVFGGIELKSLRLSLSFDRLFCKPFPERLLPLSYMNIFGQQSNNSFAYKHTSFNRKILGSQ